VQCVFGGDVSCPQLPCHPDSCFPSRLDCRRVQEGPCVCSSVSDADADSWPLPGEELVDCGALQDVKLQYKLVKLVKRS